MSVDTALKRFSLMRLGTPGQTFPPDTNGVDQGERVSLLGLYASTDVQTGATVAVSSPTAASTSLPIIVFHTTGKTVYCLIFDSEYNMYYAADGSFQSLGDNLDSTPSGLDSCLDQEAYAVYLTEEPCVAGMYIGSVPISQSGTYMIVAFELVGATAASWVDTFLDAQIVAFDGEKEIGNKELYDIIGAVFGKLNSGISSSVTDGSFTAADRRMLSELFQRKRNNRSR